MNQTASRPLVVVGLGEALFDRFPKGELLGGAPLNLAFHAHQLLSPFGGRGLIASRIGDDGLGKKLLDELQKRQLSPELIQIDSSHPTGDVLVSVQEGTPEYCITEHVAWDHLEWDASWQAAASTCDAVCFGTLAQRCHESRETIIRFLQQAEHALVVCDLNLRGNYYDADSIWRSMGQSDIVKLNEDEMRVVSRFAGWLESGHDLWQKALAEFDLKLIALTRGEKGTVIIAADQVVESEVPTYPAVDNADSVGAGDASCAGLIFGRLLGWSLKDTLELSNRTGAFVASQFGATPPFGTELLGWIERKQAAYGLKRQMTDGEQETVNKIR